MEMIKAANKLKKLWPIKKRKKKTYKDHHFYYLPPPPLPPPCHCCCSYSTPIEPSAPPLPPWLDTQQSISVAEVQVGYENQVQFPTQEINEETNPIYTTVQDETPLGYQQYTVPNPVYGVPVVQRPRRESKGGIFRCVIEFGVNLFRCFCPCFCIRRV